MKNDVHIEKFGWLITVRGLASFALALALLLAWPQLPVIAVAFGAYAIVDGLASLAFVFPLRGGRVGTYLGRGVIGVAAGGFALAAAGAPALSLTMLVAAWACATGALELAFGSRAWSIVPQPRAFMVDGMLSLGLGLTLLTFPLEGRVLLLLCIPAYAIMNGVASTALGLRIHDARLAV